MTARQADVLLARLRELDRDTPAAEHGQAAARERAAIVDAWLADLFEEAGAPRGVALAALGGYGRGMLLPGSDIDLLILHANVEAIDAFAEQVFYPLWDSGLTVGHNVRTPKECRIEAAGRVDVATAMLHARLVAGDASLVEATVSEVTDLARADPEKWIASLRRDADDRHAHFASVASKLEPDLKDGSGGLRDLDSIAWLGVALGTAGADGLVGLGLLGARESETLEAAREFLVRVRSVLHLVTGGRLDRLVVDHQDAIAELMEYRATPTLPAADALLRDVFAAGRDVAWSVPALFDRAAGAGSITGPPLDPTPEGVMRAFAESAETGRPIALDQLEQIRGVRLPVEGVVWNAETCAEFLRLLRAPRARAVLEAMDRTGVLIRFFPDWEAVRFRPQRDPFHRFTVDLHLLETLDAMQNVLAGLGPLAQEPMTTEAVKILADREAALLGALLHDIGKVGSGHHVDVGASVSRRTLERMGIDEQTRDLARALVEEHLLLPDTATRRDLSDENLVVGVAARIGGPERLAALYLLTLADAQATGRHAFTPWRQALIRELVSKVQGVYDRGEVGPETGDTLAERSAGIRTILAAEDLDLVERFIEGLPATYLLTLSPDEIAGHYALLGPALDPHEIRTSEVRGPDEGTVRLSVVSADRPGLLAKIAGALSLCGFSILTAQVFTTTAGVAIDLFDVMSAFDQPMGEERWRTFRSTLRRSLDGRIALEHRVREKRGHYPPHRSAIPVEVTIDNKASDFSTVIEVGCADRIGLLFDLTRTLSELELDVRLAKVATYGGRVVDAFYVRDVLGRKVEDPEQATEIRRAIEARLAD